jgi:5'-nucleotidase
MIMRILLTNDDGIFAEGIHALWQVLSEIGEVFVAAPDRERSATGHAITVHQPIRVDEHCFKDGKMCGWRIGGTPADCVKIAVEALLPEKPDFILSGINHGLNLGTDVLYSGTVSAALEGVLLGVPSIAVSLDMGTNGGNFVPAAQFAGKLIKKVMHSPLPANTLLNVNLPDGVDGCSAKVAVTTLGIRQYENLFDQRRDPRGRTYYWMGGGIVDNANAADSDVSAVKNGKISVTPLHFDLTNYKVMEEIKALLL